MKKKILRILVLAVIVVSAGFLLYRKSTMPITTIVSTDTIDYEITKKYVPDTREKMVIIKYSENGYETIISMGIGYRISSVRNIETNAYKMYMSDKDTPKFIFDEYPSDEELISGYLDFEKDRLIGQYGEVFEDSSTVTETTPADYPAVDVIGADNALICADIISERITRAVNTSSTPENPQFNYRFFICRMTYIDDTEFCYYNIFPLLQDKGVSQFKVTNMNKVIRHVFGDYDWDVLTDFGNPPNGEYNENTKSFEFSTDFGWGVQSYRVNGDINSYFSDDGKQIYSEFEMLAPDSSSGDPDHKSIGHYRLVYDIITEDGETFLRFNRYQKI